MKVRINQDLTLDIELPEGEVSYEKIMGIAQTLKKFDRLANNIRNKPNNTWIKVTPEMKKDAKRLTGPQLAKKYNLPPNKGSNIVFRYKNK